METATYDIAFGDSDEWEKLKKEARCTGRFLICMKNVLDIGLGCKKCIAVCSLAPLVITIMQSMLKHPACLKRLGYVVQIIPSDCLNRVTIHMCDVEIFRCDIRNLMFNIPCNDDEICRRAVQAIEEARKRIVSSDIYQETILSHQEAERLLSTAGLYSSNILLNFNISSSQHDLSTLK